MKLRSLLQLTALLTALATVGTACKNPDKNLTPIPGGGSRRGGPGTDGPGGPLDGSGTAGNTVIGNEPIGLADMSSFENMDPDRAFFASDTIYFEFDRHAVPSGERSKIENVASYLKGNGSHKLRVEGHCDERGTEEYNRSLGERRAQAIREALIELGVSPDRIQTLSFGEDQPAVTENNDAAWAKNRRGEFILLRPKP
jgi:peptidoglycan-associated lipoprotein